MNKSRWIAVGLAAVVAVGAGVLVRESLTQSPVESEASRRLAVAQLRDLSGAPSSIERWKGQIVVINFWATWCAPCREETPVLVQAQSKLAGDGVQIVGIALDSADTVKVFGTEFGVNYPLLLGGTDMIQLMKALGNKAGGLPFTVVIDRQGEFRGSHLGAVNQSQVERLVRTAAGHS